MTSSFLFSSLSFWPVRSLVASLSLLATPSERIDLSNAWKSGRKIADGAISLLPNLAIAVVIFALFLIVASAARHAVRRVALRRQRRKNIGLLLGRLAYVTIVIVGLLIALSTIAPSFTAGDLIKVLGVGSVAIGFAFQNILQNFLAGILLLLQEPFEIGDYISVTGLEGRVDDIETRATIITTSDGHRVIIPNAVLFTSPVSVTIRAPQASALNPPISEPPATNPPVTTPPSPGPATPPKPTPEPPAPPAPATPPEPQREPGPEPAPVTEPQREPHSVGSR
jgi:small-conductance mechanosensitive channel